jgi:hypothetical protein
MVATLAGVLGKDLAPGRRDAVSREGTRSARAGKSLRIGTSKGAGPGRLLGVGMRIDIDKLTEAELIDLNNRIVERLRFLNQMRAHAKMLEFKIGDRVSFQPEGQRSVVGILTRYNRKTVTVITDDGQRWNVSPARLHRAESSREGEAATAHVIPLRTK